MPRAELARHLGAVRTGKRQVHEDHGRKDLLDEPECLVPVGGFADDVVARELQGDAHRLAQHDVVVDDQDARPAVQHGLDPLPGRALQASWGTSARPSTA
jgi:hypothetical protein